MLGQGLLAAELSAAVPSSPPLPAVAAGGTESDTAGALPPLAHIEQRGVSAKFLAGVVRTFLTEAMAIDASVAAATYLKTQIAAVEAEIERERGAQSK
eukprot:COSAG02_NODE_10116_length_2017_cov_11.671011_1_plen_98_part_00